MSISYGTITITDTTDLGQLSVYLTGSTVRQQIYDAGNNPPTTATYYPNWTVNNPFVITPHVYYNGESYLTSSNKWEIHWSKTENGINYATLPATGQPESYPSDGKSLQRPTNLTINSTGVTYTATITFYPIDGDRTTTIVGVATLDLTIANNGEKGADGQPGTPAKTLQLVGSGSHFAYDNQGTAIGVTAIDLTVEKSSTISGVHWYCDSVLIESNNTPYTALSLQVTTSNINTYSSGYKTNKSAQFKIVEIDSSGNEILNGLTDYFTIYKLQDAAPGNSTYSAYLDNDQETVNEYNGAIDFTNATTIFHLDKGGQNNLVANSGWTISITDSGNITYQTGKSTFNTLPAGNNNEITRVTAMTGNTAWIQFTAQNTNSSISNQVKRFTIQKNPSLISHALRLNSVVANRDTTVVPNGNYTPSQIIVDAIVRTGGGTEDYHVANTIEAVIYYKDGTNGNTLYNGDAALTITLADKIATNDNPASAIDYINTTLKYNNETVDTQKIVISCDGIDGEDGEDGESPWNFMIGNQFDGISTDFDYKTSQTFTIKIPVEAMHGIDAKTIYRGGSTYPTLRNAPTIFSSITPKYYLGENEVVGNGAIDNVRYVITANTNIGATGSITLELEYADNQTLSQTYTYKAQPEALKPIRVLLEPNPSDTFENQEGTITVTPSVMSGTSPVASSAWGSPTWKVFDGTWKTIAEYGDSDITVSNNILSVKGTSVSGYLGFSFTVSITRGGVTETYTEYINLKDIDDPLQVSLHSTVGEQIVNGQGIGVIYARVIRRGDGEDYDTIVPDNLLAVDTTAPTSSTAPGKTGYCYVVLDNNSPAKPTGEVRYYWRSAGSGDWSGPRGTTTNPYKYTYTWYFRDSNNQAYAYNNASTPTVLNYLLETNSSTHKPVHNQQFVYVDSTVVKNKVTAVAKVEI